MGAATVFHRQRRRIEALGRRSQSASKLRDRVERSGVATTGTRETVTRAKSYSVNYQFVTHLTVRFTDRDNRTRWTILTIPGIVSNGAQVKVRYSPGDLGRKAAAVVSR